MEPSGQNLMKGWRTERDAEEICCGRLGEKGQKNEGRDPADRAMRRANAVNRLPTCNDGGQGPTAGGRCDGCGLRFIVPFRRGGGAESVGRRIARPGGGRALPGGADAP